MQAPITVLQANTKRDIGRKAQLGNIMAGKVGSFLHYYLCSMHRQICARHDLFIEDEIRTKSACNTVERIMHR